MTTSISIATKQPTKRAKGLILRGDHGKHARHDNSHVYREKDDPKPMLGIRGGIILNSSKEHFVVDSDDNGQRSNRAVFTTESPGFAVKPPTHRRRVRNVRRSQAVAPPECDSDDDHIVVVSDCDAWRLRCAR